MAEIVLQASMLVAGLLVLWWAGDRTVRYAIELADMYGVHSFTVGFLLISVTTGIPEIMTAAVSALEGVAPLSAGDIIGSSLVNVSLVLGLATVVAGNIAIERRYEASLLKIMAVITVLTTAIVLTSHLTVVHGVVLLVVYAAAVGYLRQGGLIEKIVREEESEAEEERAEEIMLTGMRGTALKLSASLILVLVGARLTVGSAVSLGTMFGLGLETLGATVVAVGTGLPEITLELNAVRRREYALALGDIFGSTLVNLTLVLGVLAIISPTDIAVFPLLGALTFMAGTLVFLWVAMMRNHGLERRHGLILLVFFLIYIVEEIGLTALVA